MIKTVKTKKQLRLDELLKYILDNDIVGKRYEERMDYDSYSITHAVHVTGGGEVIIEGTYKPDQTFTVEVEEPITEDTRIPKTVTLTENEEACRSWNNSINGLKRAYPGALQIHAIVNGKLQLIWEKK